MMSAQTYNFVAKRIREQFPITPINNKSIQVIRGTLCELAIECAKGFEKDNPNFDVTKFLDACSPDTDRYPISELWEEYGKSS